MREEFCTAVKILLQRMETHPEEFYIEMPPNRAADNPKWGHIITQIVSLKNGGDIRGEAIFLTAAEQDALYESYTKLRRKALDDYVMREVLTPEEKEDTGTVTMKTQGRYVFQTNGQERFRVDPSGNLGIGIIAQEVSSVVPDAFVYGSVAEAQAARSTMLQQIQARQQGLLGDIK
jgi:hypothetical protein